CFARLIVFQHWTFDNTRIRVSINVFHEIVFFYYFRSLRNVFSSYSSRTFGTFNKLQITGISCSIGPIYRICRNFVGPLSSIQDYFCQFILFTLKTIFNNFSIVYQLFQEIWNDTLWMFTELVRLIINNNYMTLIIIDFIGRIIWNKS